MLDNFITDLGSKKKVGRLLNQQEFSRSISVPADKLPNKQQLPPDKCRLPSSPDDSDTGGGASPGIWRGSAAGKPTTNAAVFTMGSPASPCYPAFPHSSSVISNSDLDDSGGSRRSSSAAVLTPDVDTAARTAQEQDRFYLLKKDSERRMTLSQVLEQDHTLLAQTWLQNTQEGLQPNAMPIQQDQLQDLMYGLQAHIADQQRGPLVKALAKLKESLESYPDAIDHIRLALYTFPDAVSAVLKRHSIKPHWMFAFDDLVRSAVHTAMNILQPEDAVGVSTEGVGEEQSITPGISTVNSMKSATAGVGTAEILHHQSNLCLELHHQLQTTKQINVNLLHELNTTEQRYQILLEQCLREKEEQVKALQSSSASAPIIFAPHSASAALSSAARLTPVEGDPILLEWLRHRNLPSPVIENVSHFICNILHVKLKHLQFNNE